jgi:predicted RND superfamily exporter protein
MKSSFFARHSLVILFVTVFFLPLSVAGAWRALQSNRNDVKDWLPSTYEETTEFKWFQQHFAGEEFILVSWDGCTLDDQRLRLLVQKLTTPAKPGLLPNEQQPEQPTKTFLGFSFNWGVKKPDPSRSLFDEASTGPGIIETMTQPPLNLTRDEALHRLKGSLIGPNLSQTCALITLSNEGKRFPRQAINRVYEAATGECNIPRASIHMGGPPVDSVAIDMAGEKSLFRLAGVAGGIGLIISWWCLRSARLIVMVFTAGIYSAALSLAIVYYAGTPMNAILLTMPSLVYVAAISGAIHLSNYYRDTAVEDGLAGAPGRALIHAALPLGLATGTTAIGLLSLCYSELVPIQLFGLYSAIGVVASLLLLCLFLPAAFQLFPVKAGKPAAAEAAEHHDEALLGPAFSPHWWKVADFVIERHGLVTLFGVVVLAVCGWGMTKMQTSVQLMRMFPPGAPILADYKWLEENLGELVPMEIVLRIHPETCKLNLLERMELVERVQKHVEEIPEVGSSLSAVTFSRKLPKPEDYRNKAGSSGLGSAFGKMVNGYKIARKRYNESLEEHRGEILKQDYLAEENGDELWRISARIGALKDVDFGEFVKDIKREVEPLLDEERAQGSPGISAVYTGLVPVIYKAQRSLLDGLLFGFVMDLVLVTIVMMIAVREWSAGIVLLLPSIFPVIVVFGLMGWMGIIVDTGTVMAPAVALGVTVDDVVHFMLMYRGGLKRGLGRRDSLMLAYKGCARAMYQSWGVIGLGLSAFAMSPFTPTQRFGYLMVTLLTSALVGNLIILPAVLAGPLGGLFGRRFQRPRPPVEDDTVSSVPEPVIARSRNLDEPVAGHRPRSVEASGH